MRISVIIPTYNRESYLSRAIDSVISQTLKPFEIIVIDDGSSDGTKNLIKNNYSDIKLITQKNKGVSAARNIGIIKSRGDWIALLDSDDEWEKTKLELQSQEVLKNPQYLICHTNEIWIRDGVRVNQKKKHQKFGGYIYKKCLDICRISPSSAMIKKTLFNEIGFFDENLRLCEDYDLWLRITLKHKVLFIDKPLIIKHGGHEGQLSKLEGGIEQYRIQSLENILNQEQLPGVIKNSTILMLIKKLNIFKNGLEKRKKLPQVSKLETKIKFWKKKLVK